jgi:hypothetical protein
MKVIRKPLKTGGTAIPPSARLGLTLSPLAEGSAAGSAPREITVFIDGVDSGLLPKNVTEIYLTPEEPCLVSLGHDGAAAAGEFEVGTLGNCVVTEVTLAGGDIFATIPRCTSDVDITVECRESPATPHIVISDGSGELGAASLAALLPDITIIINGVNVGTVSRCANEITVETSGSCTLVGELCVGSGSVTVDDDQGNGYAEAFTC